jgi:hypothetical protein
LALAMALSTPSVTEVKGDPGFPHVHSPLFIGFLLEHLYCTPAKNRCLV